VYLSGSAPQRGQPFHSDYKWPETLDYSR